MEHRKAYPTDTQDIVNLSGYVWAARQVSKLDRLSMLDLDCAPEIVARNRARYGHSGASFWRWMAVRRFDPDGIRNLIPRSIRHWLSSLVSRLDGAPALDAITPEDIE